MFKQGSSSTFLMDEDGGRSCCRCSKRLICILLSVFCLLGVLAVILIPLIIPQMIKKQSIDSLEVSEETEKILKQLNAYTSVIASALGPNIRAAGPSTNEDIRSEEFDLGWILDTSPSSEEEDGAENDGSNGYGWSPKDIVHTDSESRDLNTTLFVQQVTLTDSFSYEIVPNDDITAMVSAEFFETALLLRNERFLPLKDNIEYFDSNEARDDLLADLGLLPLGLANGYLLPVPPHEWEEMISDEAISRLFWYGVGAVLITGPEFRELYDETKSVSGHAVQEEARLSGFEIDLDISSLPVRKGFHPYGFRITFDLDQKVTSIYDPASDTLFLPQDNNAAWNRAKFWVKNTVLTVVTAREHLQWSHLIASNSLTRAQIIYLPPNHPIRRLVSIFTFNTNMVNVNAQEILTPELGYVHRMTALTYPSLLQVFDSGFIACNIFQPFSSMRIGRGVKTLAQQGKFPYYTEGLAYYMIVHEFVADWLSLAGDGASDGFALAFYEDFVRSSKGQAYEVPPYSHSNMVDLIAQLLFVVTAYHEVVGNVVEYTQLPEFMPFRAAQDGQAVGDIETFLLGAYLTGLTGFRMPMLMADFPNFFGVGDGIPGWEIDVWGHFQANLAAQSEVVQAANAERIAAGQPEFKILDPASFECAITV